MIAVIARLTYQACSDKACLPPETVEEETPEWLEDSKMEDEEGGKATIPALPQIAIPEYVKVQTAA